MKDCWESATFSVAHCADCYILSVPRGGLSRKVEVLPGSGRTQFLGRLRRLGVEPLRAGLFRVPGWDVRSLTVWFRAWCTTEEGPPLALRGYGATHSKPGWKCGS